MRTGYLHLTKPHKQTMGFNPTLPPKRIEPKKVGISITTYDNTGTESSNTNDIEAVKQCSSPDKRYWINIDGIQKNIVERIGQLFNIHILITEDILSQGQRPKMDEMDNLISALLYMIYYDDESQTVETEQITILLGKNFVISFQEDPTHDLFVSIKNKLQIDDSRLRTYSADYLFYSLIDSIVDNYFIVLEKLGEKIEFLEDEIVKNATTTTLNEINRLRKEMVLLKRNVTPVRELVNGILRSDSNLIEEKTERYFKDIYDHIVQASDLSDNYRDIVMSLHDLYLSELNLRMNEAMKVMAIVTCLLAPATVIGGIFGMNFNHIPLLDRPWGFGSAVLAMLLIPVWMVFWFKKRGWF